MRCLVVLTGLFVFSFCAAAATSIEVEPTQLGDSFEVDIDVDGKAELYGGWYTEASGSLTFGVRVGVTDEVVTLGANVFRGISAVATETLVELYEAEGFATSFDPPTSVARHPGLDDVSGGLFLTADRPILGCWGYGTSGGLSNGGMADDPVRLVGLVIDATEYFTSGRTSAVKVYWNDYGAIASGEAARWITLADTGVPRHVESLGGVLSEFVGRRKICFRFESELGLKYRVLRNTGRDDPEEVLVADGTGEQMTLVWDDSGRESSKAFFTLEEFGADAFAP